MLPRDVTVAIIEEELSAAMVWAAANGVKLSWHPRLLQVRATLRQRSTGELFYLRGRMEGYRVVPPAWDFGDKKWHSADVKQNYPQPAQVPGVSSSIFHTQPVICAPFNRLAYKDHGGPHSDWGGPERWLDVNRTLVRAETLADMLDVVHRDLLYSPGRLS